MAIGEFPTSMEEGRGRVSFAEWLEKAATDPQVCVQAVEKGVVPESGRRESSSVLEERKREVAGQLREAAVFFCGGERGVFVTSPHVHAALTSLAGKAESDWSRLDGGIDDEIAREIEAAVSGWAKEVGASWREEAKRAGVLRTEILPLGGGFLVRERYDHDPEDPKAEHRKSRSGAKFYIVKVG